MKYFSVLGCFIVEAEIPVVLHAWEDSRTALRQPGGQAHVKSATHEDTHAVQGRTTQCVGDSLSPICKTL